MYQYVPIRENVYELYRSNTIFRRMEQKPHIDIIGDSGHSTDHSPDLVISMVLVSR
jgi:hypothetical protein